MPKVFIPHLVTRFDGARNRIVPTLDFTPATEFGELNLLLDDDINPLFFQQTVELLKKRLDGITVRDYFLPVGDPSIIAACGAIISEKIGVINILKWDKKSRRYIELRGYL